MAVKAGWGQTVKGQERLRGMPLDAQKQSYDNSIYFISVGGLVEAIL